MKKFDEQLSRMQALMRYGMVSESKSKNGSFEYHRVASDGKSYGIFKECSKYYIKSAPAEKENLAEAYDYIGGWNNRKDYEYDSFANAQKQFDLKMMSINEACGAKGNAATLDPSKKQEYIVEGTDKMKREIARQRQIMANTATIIREGSYIGVGDPERVSGNNDEDKPYTEKGEAKLDKDMPKANCKPAAESNPYGDGKAPEKGKDVKSSDVLSNGTSVAAEHPSGGKVTRVDEECKGCVNNSAPNDARDWGSEGIGKGNGDPKENGWEMDGQEYVNEEINDAKEWDEGLPGSAGTGEADTDHNNDPYKENVNEAEEDDYEVEGGDEEKPSDVEGEETPVEPESEELPGDEELPAEDELGDEELGDEDLEAEIAELRAEIEALKAQIEGGEEEAPAEELPADDELGGEELPADDLGGEELPADDLGGEEPIDLDAAEGGEELPAPEEEEGDIEEGRGLTALKTAFNNGRENVEDGTDDRFISGELRKNAINKGVAATDAEFDNKTATPTVNYDNYRDARLAYKNASNDDERRRAAMDSFEARPGFLGKADRTMGVAAYNAGVASKKVGNAIRNGAQAVKQGVGNFVHNTIGLEESKQAFMNSVVNSVVSDILAEEKTVLHDFGNHPGYRKKPMDLPPTGSDNVDGKKDWNDDSVHSEEPFGKTIGDGKPYEKLAQLITDRVMEQIKKKA